MRITSEKTKRKISKSLKGKNTWAKGRTVLKSTKEKLSKAHMGRKLPEKTKQKMREYHRKHNKPFFSKCGKDNPNWKGGINPINKSIRNSLEYKRWRQSVFIRDNFTCKDCQVRGRDLEAHHLLLFSKFPQFRFDVWNGITLCKKCHNKTKRRRYHA